MRTSAWASAALLTLSLAACNVQAQPATKSGAALKIPTGGLAGLARTGDYFVFTLLHSSDHNFRLWRMRTDGSNLRELTFPSDPKCQLEEYLYPRSLTDGGVAVNRVCSLPPPVIGYSATYSVEELAQDGTRAKVLSAPQHDANPGPVTWQTDLSRGLATTGDGTCDTLISITPAGEAAVHLVLQDGNRRWDLSAVPHGTCDDQGLAGWPAWSADGRTIAFVGSLDAIGQHGFDRPRQPWSIYLMDAHDLKPRVLISGIHHPRDLQWSSDGTRLAFSGVGTDGRSGTWFVTRQGKLTMVYPVAAEYLTWLPGDTGLALAIPHPDAELNDHDELRLVPLP